MTLIIDITLTFLALAGFCTSLLFIGYCANQVGIKETVDALWIGLRSNLYGTKIAALNWVANAVFIWSMVHFDLLISLTTSVCLTLIFVTLMVVGWIATRRETVSA